MPPHQGWHALCCTKGKELSVADYANSTLNNNYSLEKT